ncbi:MAG: GNAT family N-acetyltransferase [Alphaproteobacteria bacterium]|nr:GNAT family N-acetyltransferase [Alphaproteobacteria bacterium]
MAAIEGLTRVSLDEEHLDDACALVDEAGWNETADDWRMMIDAGHAIGFEDGNGKLVASALTLPYGEDFGWISMVLVTAAWRRKGIATWLLDACIAELENAGRIPVLDATPDGEKVYERLGFESHFTIRRWQSSSPAAPARGDPAVRPLTGDDLPGLFGYDREIFGGNRASVLADIALRNGHGGWVIDGRNGFLLSRAGRRARQLGPLCADDDATATALLSAALAQFEEPVFIDVPDRHTAVCEMLEAQGFTVQRPFRRMYRGDTDGFGDIARSYAIAGPELG